MVVYQETEVTLILSSVWNQFYDFIPGCILSCKNNRVKWYKSSQCPFMLECYF